MSRERTIPIQFATGPRLSTVTTSSIHQGDTGRSSSPFNSFAQPFMGHVNNPTGEVNSVQIKVANGSSPEPNSMPSQSSQQSEQYNGPLVQRPPLRKMSTIDDLGEKLVAMLDEIERRVEHLRETASLMEQEKESLIEMLNTVNLNKSLLHLRPGEKEDIDATTDRLMIRCKTVDVNVNTPRNDDQELALTKVNEMVESMLGRTAEDLQSTREVCRRFLNACNPDQPDGSIDQKFQNYVLGCTAEDQKRIRRRLETIVGHLERADQSIGLAQGRHG